MTSLQKSSSLRTTTNDSAIRSALSSTLNMEHPNYIKNEEQKNIEIISVEKKHTPEISDSSKFLTRLVDGKTVASTINEIKSCKQDEFNVPALPPSARQIGTGLSKSGSAVGTISHQHYYHHHYYPHSRQNLRYSAANGKSGASNKIHNNNASSTTTKKTADSGFSSGSSGYVASTAGSPPGGTFMLGSF